MQFYKYHGAGNDFILVDNRVENITLSNEQIAHLCNRRLGIGADGLMLLENTEGYHFKMVYYNSDGNESTMCGNGGRCITAFAKELGIITDAAEFLATGGVYVSTMHADGTIRLKMQDVKDIQLLESHAILNTGSPHYIVWVDSVVDTDVYAKGNKIRNSEAFQPAGINVNFVQRISSNKLLVRTYERGVEDETLSCGTGVTAAAIAATGKETGVFTTEVETPGGHLKVNFTKDTPLSATNVMLTGPVVMVFKGEVAL